MDYETILVEQRGAVTLITLNRPKALNALNSHVLDELIDAFAAFEADEDAEVRYRLDLAGHLVSAVDVDRKLRPRIRLTLLYA